jgi:hypothetical protein
LRAKNCRKTIRADTGEKADNTLKWAMAHEPRVIGSYFLFINLFTIKNMEQIIQLRKSEYDKLIELSNMNTELIENKAEELFQERGTYGIKLELDTQQDYHDNFYFTANSYVKDWDNKFPISEHDKRKIVDFVNYRAKQMLVKKFGKQITNINFYNKEVDSLNKLKTKFLVFTATGWALAVILTIIALFYNCR